jgi:hypothetical protein
MCATQTLLSTGNGKYTLRLRRCPTRNQISLILELRKLIRAPEPRCAADTAGAVVTWVRSSRKPRSPLCVLTFFPQPLGRRLAVCSAGRQPAASSLTTPASGAADSWALGCRPEGGRRTREHGSGGSTSTTILLNSGRRLDNHQNPLEQGPAASQSLQSS